VHANCLEDINVPAHTAARLAQEFATNPGKVTAVHVGNAKPGANTKPVPAFDIRLRRYHAPCSSSSRRR
jgi:hypothetical protein